LIRPLKIGVDQTKIGLIYGRNKGCVTDSFPSRELREPAVLVDAGSLLVGHGLVLMYHA
jgi:hypothetical protein